MRADTLRKRYLSKVFANSIGLVISLVTMGIIPRGLGPNMYGNFSFLSDFFNRLVGFLDMGTSTAFYTKLSQRQRDFGIVSFYIMFACLASLLVFAFVGFAQITVSYNILWPDQKLFYIYLAAIWGVLTWFVKILNLMTDAYGVTVSAEIAKIIQKGIGLALIFALYFTNQLDLTHFFLYHYVILILLALAFIWVMECNGISFRQSWKLSPRKIKAYIKEFYDYSHPLFVISLIGLVLGILDRWMLQMFGGGVEQGFYGLSAQIGAVCFLFAGAMTPLLMREFAIAFSKHDIPEMALLFRRYVPMLYTLTAYFACFIAVEASKVTFIFGGEKFQQAALAVMIMAFFPIHQTYGQLTASVFYAMGETRLYRNIAIAFMLVGPPITYFLIAPEDKMGLNAGATGLAIKMVAIQLIGVNVQLYYSARILGLRFWRYLGHQIVSVGCLLSVAAIIMFAVDKGFGLHDKVILSFILSGFLYSIIVIVLLYFQPIVFGLTKGDVGNFIQFVIRKVKQV